LIPSISKCRSKDTHTLSVCHLYLSLSCLPLSSNPWREIRSQSTKRIGNQRILPFITPFRLNDPLLSTDVMLCSSSSYPTDSFVIITLILTMNPTMLSSDQTRGFPYNNNIQVPFQGSHQTGMADASGQSPSSMDNNDLE
jgi:hypothetical protein